MRWRKIVGWSVAALGSLLVAVIVAGSIFLGSARFQRLAIRAIVQDADKATGGRTEIGGLDFKISTLTAHFYNVTLHGKESADQPPLLHLDELTVGLKIQSVLRRRFKLTQLGIEHPVLHVEADENGASNLPRPSPKKSGGGNVFDLAAGHVFVTNGQITYSDRTIPIDADLYDLKTEIHFESNAIRYRGVISYDRGSLRYGDDPTFPHSLDARFTATPDVFTLEPAVLKVGSSTLSVKADLSNYSDPIIHGDYSLQIHAPDFSAMAQPITPAGDVTISGTFHYQGAGQAILRSIVLNGQLASEELSAASSEGQINLRKLRGRFNFANANLQAHDLTFETLGGRVSTDVSLEHLDTTAVGQLRTTLSGISIRAAQQAIHHADLQRIVLSSNLSGTVDASWTGGVSKARVQTDLHLKSSPTQTASRQVGVDGALHASYDAQRNVLAFRDTSLRIPSAAVAAQGQVGDHSNLQLQINASDLHGAAEVLAASGIQQADSLDLAGSASLNATVQGSLKNPHVSGVISAEKLKVQGSEWRSAHASFQVSSSQISLRDAVLVSAHQGKASLSGSVVLRNWKYLPSSAIVANLEAQRMSITDLQRIANVYYPVSGDLSANISFRGSQLNPAGSGSASIEHAQAFKESIQRIAATFRDDRNSLTSTLAVGVPAGAATGTLTYTPTTKAYVVSLNAPSVALQKLRIVQAKNLGVSGTLTISANGRGTLDNPQLEAMVQIPQLQLRNKSISQMKGQLTVANHRAELSMDSQVAQATLHSRATVALSGDYDTEASIDTSEVPLESLLGAYTNSPPSFHGETELHATMKGPLKDPSRIVAHVTLPSFEASYQSLEIGAASPIRADYANSVITLQPAEIRGTGTSLRVQGMVPLTGATTPSLTASGTVDVRVIKIFDPDIESSGTVALDVQASGTAKNPAVQGRLHFQDVALSTPTAPLSVQKLNGTLHIADNTLQLTGLTGEVGGGRVSAGGSISYRPDLQFNVTLQGESVRLRYPDGMRALLDSNLVLSGNKNASLLNGRVLIDSLSFTPDFDLSKFGDQFGGSTIPAAPGFADTIKLAVGVQSKTNLSASSSQISLEGEVNLQVVGTAANPVVVGRTDLTSGELFYRNVRYQLQRGIITFDNPTQTDPTLNVSATTTIEQYNLTITLRGPFDKLTTSYTSDPPLATADVISLIANGQTTSEASAAGTTTDSILASQVAGQVTGGIQHLAGISSLQIDPLLGGNNQNPSARVALQQRVTKNFLFTFSTDLSQPGSEIVQGDYQINKRWSVSVTRDEVGGVSVDGKYHTKF